MNRSEGVSRRRRRIAGCLVALASVGVATTAGASHSGIDTEGHSTLEQTIVPAESPVVGFTNLTLGPADAGGYNLRDGANETNPAIPDAQSGRENRRTSMVYFSQLTDFQLADEESPVRVEFVDPGAGSAHRPQEALTPFQMEATVRQINEFADASPVAQAGGIRAPMGFTILSGDQADNNQLNEMRWVRELLEGTAGPVDFNSGLTDPAAYANPGSLSASCNAFVLQEGSAAAAAAEAAGYTGVQDYDDYPAGAPPIAPSFYDPDDPSAPNYADWPEYDGLLDRAQSIAFAPEGLDVPFYVANGNHDVLVQGNEDATAAFEEIATNCFKALGTTNTAGQPSGFDELDPRVLLSPLGVGMLIPPDPARQFVSKPQIKEVFSSTDLGAPDDDHGFAYVDDAENTASNGSASYYAWNPVQAPGFRFIAVDTNSEGGQTAEGASAGSANGNIDDPQFQWLKAELDEAEERGELVVMFAHHPVRSLNTEIRDEQAPACTGPPDGHGHGPNPGCDLDPRFSGDNPATPAIECIHNGTDAQNSTCSDAQHESFVELVDASPNVVAFVPGHTHEHKITPFVRTDGSTWWEINTSSVTDYPNESRLIEFMDNHDGTLSIFNTVVDHAAPSIAPAECPDPAPDCGPTLTEPQLGSIARTLTYNDGHSSGAGTPLDRNVELLLEDPRVAAAPGPGPGPDPNPDADTSCAGKTATIAGTSDDETLVGTTGRDVIAAGAGDDLIRGRGGNDVICGGRGDDRIRAKSGDDKVRGEGGADGLRGGDGNDRLAGGSGRDGLSGGADFDRCKGGSGRDEAPDDTCERARL